MKYGNLKGYVPDYTEDVNALKDLLSKGEITKDEYNSKIAYFQKVRLSSIVFTNGGFTPKKMSMKDRVSIEEMSANQEADVNLKIAEALTEETN